MPQYGIYPVDCRLDISAWDTTQATVRLQQLPRHRWSCEFSERIRVMDALLEVCEESRYEAQLRFPHVLPYPDGEMRFNGHKDLVFIECTDRLRPLMDAAMGADIEVSGLTFANDWNRLVRKLAIQSDEQESEIVSLVQNPNIDSDILDVVSPFMARFTGFLSRFDRLEQIVLVGMFGVSVEKWNETSKETRVQFYQVLRQGYRSGLPAYFGNMNIPGNGYAHSHVTQLSLFTSFFERVIHGSPNSQINKPLSHAVKFGYPELHHLDILKMYHIDPELEDLCQKMDFQ